MSTTWEVECEVHFGRGRAGRKQLHEGGEEPPACELGRVPRVARLLALAHRFEQLLRDGAVKDYAEIGRLGGVTRARVCQIASLLMLAPDVQEAVLFLPRTFRGRDPIQLYHLMPICLTPDWRRQRKMWEQLLAARTKG